MQKTVERSHRAARNFKPIEMTAENVRDYAALHNIGITFDDHSLSRMIATLDSAVISPLSPLSTPSITTPVQFLQNWLPGFVRIISAARKIDLLVGLTTAGSWEDEEIVQGVMEPTGTAELYSDYGNIPLSSYNNNFERRTVVRAEQGILVGALEDARAARIKVSTATEKRTSASLALEIFRNKVGFFGFNNGNNRTYGFLNDPSLPAYQAVPNGAWATATFLQITEDLRFLANDLQTRSQDTIDPAATPCVLVVPTNSAQFLAVVSDFGVSVRDWISKTYPQWRIESAPELNLANGGANPIYLYAESVDDGATDDSRVFVQVVPAKFQTLGVEKRAKSYIEDYTNATAGVLCKRPYAVTRGTGI
jgi:hypothetical protein